MPIDDLIVLVDNSTVPGGYTKDPIDLNEGAGGAYLYFAYRMGNEAPITDIKTIYGDSSNVPVPRTPSGQLYRVLDVDLNKGAGGKYIYACITKDPRAGAPITGFKVISGDSSGIQPPPPFQRDGLDLNLGSGGKYIYLCYSRA
jgi:hypothetical protein